MRQIRHDQLIEWLGALLGLSGSWLVALDGDLARSLMIFLLHKVESPQICGLDYLVS